MIYIALFFTHTGAVKYDRYLKKNGIKSQIKPTPRTLSSSCGVIVEFDYNENINKIISEDIEKIYNKENKDYNLIYEAE